MEHIFATMIFYQTNLVSLWTKEVFVLLYQVFNKLFTVIAGVSIN